MNKKNCNNNHYNSMVIITIGVLATLGPGVKAAGGDVFGISSFEVPKHAERNTNQTLNCTVDPGQYKLDFIKWYHNNEEFLRYYAEEDVEENLITYQNNDINFTTTTGHVVTLLNVDLSAKGTYVCEATSAFPSNTVDSRAANLTVVVLPDEKPKIEGEGSGRYTVGDTVNLNCTAPPSLPPATLLWFINDNQAPEEYMFNYPEEKRKDGLSVSRLSLKFTLTSEHFINGELKLKCTATIETLYRSSDEHSQQTSNHNNEIQTDLPEGKSLVTTQADPTLTSAASGFNPDNKIIYTTMSQMIIFLTLLLLR